MSFGEVFTDNTIDGEVFAVVNEMRAVIVISVAEVARKLRIAIDDNTGMYEDPDEAMQAIQAHVLAAIQEHLDPEG